MDITPYVERLRAELGHAAATGDEAVRQAADRLGTALDASTRLVLMEALSEATAEITSAMRAGSVETRLNGRELEFVVNHPAPPTPPAPPAPPAPEEAEDDVDGPTARITLRLPEALKARVEELASKNGQSLNTWIVGALRRASREGAVSVDIDLSSLPFFDGDFPGGGRRGPRRMTGWL